MVAAEFVTAEDGSGLVHLALFGLAALRRLPAHDLVRAVADDAGNAYADGPGAPRLGLDLGDLLERASSPLGLARAARFWIGEFGVLDGVVLHEGLRVGLEAPHLERLLEENGEILAQLLKGQIDLEAIHSRGYAFLAP